MGSPTGRGADRWADDPFPGEVERALVYVHVMAQGEKRASAVADIVLRQAEDGQVTVPELPDLLALLLDDLSL